MITILSQDDGPSLLATVRQQLHLLPGDGLGVAVEDDDTITSRRVSTPANVGLVDLILNCPSSLEVAPRESL